MELSAAEIGLIVEALRPLCVPGWLRRIVQPDASTLVLEIHAAGERRCVQLVAAPGRSSVVLLKARPRAPERPPRFCALLRARLAGGRVVGLRQLAGDRRVLFEVDAHGERFGLEARLIGRGADLILCDPAREPLGTLSGRAQPAAPPPPLRASGAPGRFDAGSDLLEQVRVAVERADRERKLAAQRATLVRAARRGGGWFCRRRWLGGWGPRGYGARASCCATRSFCCAGGCAASRSWTIETRRWAP